MSLELSKSTNFLTDFQNCFKNIDVYIYNVVITIVCILSITCNICFFISRKRSAVQEKNVPIAPTDNILMNGVLVAKIPRDIQRLQARQWALKTFRK